MSVMLTGYSHITNESTTKKTLILCSQCKSRSSHKNVLKKKWGFMQAVYLLSTGLHTLFASPAQKKDERRWCGTSCHPRINHSGKWKFHTNKSECIYVSITLAAAVCIQSPSVIGLQITHDSVEQQSIWKPKQLPENNVKILEKRLTSMLLNLHSTMKEVLWSKHMSVWGEGRKINKSFQ